MDEEKKITITTQNRRLISTEIAGTFTGPVTREDVWHAIADPFFGGVVDQFDPEAGTFHGFRYED